jgi:hypothetical protein
MSAWRATVWSAKTKVQSAKRKSDMKPQDNSSNMKNANKGTGGQNRQHSQNQGNRGKQMQPSPNGPGPKKGK